MRNIWKNINLLNFILFGVILLALNYLLLPFLDMTPQYSLPSAMKNRSRNDTLQISRPSLRSQLEYSAIVEQNIFHPDRKVPVEKKEDTMKQALPSPEFVLYGTLVTDTTRVAYMEDLKSPRTTPGRGKRMTALSIGNIMSGFNLKQIDEDKVLMARGEEVITVLVRNPNKSKARLSTAPQREASPKPVVIQPSQKPSDQRPAGKPIQETPPLKGENLDNQQFFQDYLKQLKNNKK